MHLNIVLFIVLCIFPFISNASPIITCEDENGYIVYTRNKSDCGKNEVSESGKYSENESASDKYTVNYNSSQRTYIRAGEKWKIYIESSLLAGDEELYRSSLKKLNNVLDEVFAILPSNATEKLSELKFFLLWGDKSPSGGRKSGLSYIRKGEPKNYSYLDSRWEHALVIYSAENLIYLNELWSKKSITHELAHAWHISNWPERYPLIYDAWRNAQDSNLYLGVKDVKGNEITDAYARKNQLEYFAELSAMYFVGGNYYPYDRKGLKEYDPTGYKMVETLWK
jgi:hypothetical protein